MSDGLGQRAGLHERANLADLRLFLCNPPGFRPWCLYWRFRPMADQEIQRGVDLALRYVG